MKQQNTRSQPKDKSSVEKAQRYLPYILFMVFILIFHAPVFILYEKLVITTFLGDVYSLDWIVACGLAILFLVWLIFSFLMVKRRILFSFHFKATVVTIAAIYSIYRLCLPQSYFTSLIGAVKISDLIYLSLFIIVPVFFKARESNIESELKGYFNDEPLNNLTDNFRSDLACIVADKLIATKHDNSSFAFGIVGEWGSGKTTFLNELNRIFADKKEECEVFKFNPWQVESAASITSEFFNALANALNKLLVGFRISIDDYASSLIKETKGNIITSFASKIVFIFSSEKRTLAQKHHAVQEGIKKIGKKIIVLIDDLDRLQDSEINEVLRLIRNSASFGNLIFVAAYDRKHIEGSLSKNNVETAAKYLDKIFQGNVVMNSYKHDAIKNELINQLAKIVDAEDLNFVQSIEWNTFFAFREFEKQLVNMRDVIRYCNLMATYYPLFKDKTYFPDFFRMMFIRHLYPSAFYEIGKKYNTFFTNYTLFPYEYQQVYLVQQNDDKQYEYNEKQNVNTSSPTLLREHLSKNKFVAEEVSIVIENSLKSVFPFGTEKNTSENEMADKSYLSIRFANNFDTYFDLDNIGLSFHEFIEAFEKNYDELYTLIVGWFDKGLSDEFHFRIARITTYKSVDHFKKILMAILWAFKIDREKNNSSYSSYYGLLFGKLLLKDGFEGSSFKSIFNSLDSFRQFVYKFLEDNSDSVVTYYIIREFLAGDFSKKDIAINYLNERRLFEILVDNFAKYSINETRLTAELMQYYYEIWRIAKRSSYKIDSVHANLRNVINEENIDDFILHLIMIHFDDKHAFAFNETLLSLFDNDYSTMVDYLGKFSSKSKYFNDLKEFAGKVSKSTKAGYYIHKFDVLPTEKLQIFSPLH